jgi:hypothetical protein
MLIVRNFLLGILARSGTYRLGDSPVDIAHRTVFPCLLLFIHILDRSIYTGTYIKIITHQPL